MGRGLGPISKCCGLLYGLLWGVRALPPGGDSTRLPFFQGSHALFPVLSPAARIFSIRFFHLLACLLAPELFLKDHQAGSMEAREFNPSYFMSRSLYAVQSN